MHMQATACGQFCLLFINQEVGPDGNPALHQILDAFKLATPWIALRLWRKCHGLTRTMPLTNLIETQSRCAAAVCVLPCSTNATARARNSTGSGLPMFDPNICRNGTELYNDHLGSPEADLQRRSLYF